MCEESGMQSKNRLTLLAIVVVRGVFAAGSQHASLRDQLSMDQNKVAQGNTASFKILIKVGT